MKIEFESSEKADAVSAEALWLAYQAASPMGMGWLHEQGGEPRKDVIAACTPGGPRGGVRARLQRRAGEAGKAAVVGLHAASAGGAMTDQPTDPPTLPPPPPVPPICDCCGNVIRGHSALDLWRKTDMCPACTFGEAAALEEYDD